MSDQSTPPTRLPGTVALGNPQMMGEASLIPAAMWDVTIDVESLTASVGKRPDERSGQSYAETYLMEVTRYFTPSVMEIEGVTRTAPDRIKVEYTIAHPFAAATDPDVPASATNRADLGITGIVLFPLDVTDENPITYFADTARPIIANTDAIATADGYYVPAGLVYQLDMQANCFPFRRLVNDARRESRIGVPLVNLGVGNFDPDFGWQRSNWGPDRTGWTGYGALHQGQVARNSVELNLPLAPITSISLPVMLIAKYLDPVGPGASPADRSANRLPTSDADRTKFLYRMPQAAWDLERVEVQVDGAFDGKAASSIELRIRVADCDARADEWTAPFFNEQAPANRVRPGECGLPNLFVSIPLLSGFEVGDDIAIAGESIIRADDTVVGGDLDPDYGGAQDPLFFPLTIDRRSMPSRPQGSYRAMLRVLDPIGATLADVVFNPWLAPISSNRPMVETYAAFRVPVTGPSSEPTIVMAAATVLSGTAPAVLASHNLEGSPPCHLQVDWNGDGYFTGIGEQDSTYLTVAPTRIEGPSILSNPTLQFQPRLLHCRIWTAHPSMYETSTLPYELGPNRPPALLPGTQLSELNAQRLPAPATFLWTYGVPVDPEGDAITFVATNNVTEEIMESSTLPLAFSTTPFLSSEIELVRIEGYFSDALHPGISGTLAIEQTVRVDRDSPVGWVKQFPLTQFGNGLAGITYDNAGNLIVCGTLRKDVSLGGELLLSPGAFIAAFTPDGVHRWSRSFRSVERQPDAIQFSGLEVEPDGSLLVIGAQAADIDFGGGIRQAGAVVLLSLDSSNGSYQWDRRLPSGPVEFMPKLLTRKNGELLIGFTFYGELLVNYGGGNRTLLGSESGYIVALDALGAYQWDYVATGGRTRILDLGEDSEGHLYLAGTHQDTVDYGGGAITESDPCPLLLALTSTGQHAWTRIPSLQWDDFAAFNCVAGANSGGGCIVAGNTAGAIDLGNGNAVGGSTGFLARYDVNGSWLHEKRNTGVIRDIMPASDNGCYVVGEFRQGIDYGSGPILGTAKNDRVLARLASDGSPRWVTIWQNPDHEYGWQLAASPGNQVAIIGAFSGLADQDSSPGQFWTQAPSGSQADSILLTVRADTGQW